MDRPYPESDEIDPDLAKYLYEQCAILIIEELPVNSEFGIDLTSFKTGEKFKGVKMIPPGVHFFYASAVGKDVRQCGPRVGFYHDFKPKEIHIKRWSTIEEDFDDAFEPSNDHLDRYSSNLQELDRYLGPYRFSAYKTFLSLTDRITTDVLRDLLPVDYKVRSAPYLVRNSESDLSHGLGQIKRRTLRTVAESTEENLLPELQPSIETLIRFADIPERHNQLDSSMDPDLISQFYLDSTMRFEHVFGGEDGRRRALAEFQFSFATLIMGHVYTCFEQWRKLLVLMSSAEAALVKYRDFFIQFTRILQKQLDHAPEDLFIDITDANNLVRHRLDLFFQNCHQTRTPDDILVKETDNFKKLLEEKFGWQFELELDDELPVVVGAPAVG